jgi:dihydroxyacid dehydratase/phosphogluconate dehydratase
MSLSESDWTVKLLRPDVASSTETFQTAYQKQGLRSLCLGHVQGAVIVIRGEGPKGGPGKSPLLFYDWSLITVVR